MKIIRQTARILAPTDGMEALRRIEMAGRNCYRSEDRITEGSAVPFVKKRVDLPRTSFSAGICRHDRGIGHLPGRHGGDHPAQTFQLRH